MPLWVINLASCKYPTQVICSRPDHCQIEDHPIRWGSGFKAL